LKKRTKKLFSVLEEGCLTDWERWQQRSAIQGVLVIALMSAALGGVFFGLAVGRVPSTGQIADSAGMFISSAAVFICAIFMGMRVWALTRL
jgi:uncharacterized membrane protein YeiH